MTLVLQVVCQHNCSVNKMFWGEKGFGRRGNSRVRHQMWKVLNSLKTMLEEKGLLKIFKLFAMSPWVCHVFISLSVMLSACWYWPLCSLMLSGERGLFRGNVGLGLLWSIFLVSYK